MANILHRIIIQAKPAEVYKTFSTLEGLKNWWTRDVMASEPLEEGSVIQFRFGEGGPDMRITKIEPGKRIEWECIGGNAEEWIGTHFFFNVVAHSDKTILTFGQTGWKDETEFYMHCNCRWAYFLLSIKSLMEEDKGTPWPEAIPM